MDFESRVTVVWEKPAMKRHPDNLRSSDFTWTPPITFDSNPVPHNMTLLMQHAYARSPVIGCWQVQKVDFDPREAQGPRSFIQRRFIPKNYVRRNKLLCPEFAERPRFIMPRFKNVPPRVDDRWDKCPLDKQASQTSVVSQRRSAVSYDKKTSDVIRNIIWKKTKCGKCVDGVCNNLAHQSQSSTTPEPQETEIK